MVRLNGWAIRLTMEEAIGTLDIFANSTPCWLAAAPMTEAAVLMDWRAILSERELLAS